MRWHLPIAFAVLALSLAGRASAQPSARAASYDAEVPTAWFELAVELTERTSGFYPPVAARALGYAGLALYEAVVAGMPDHVSLVGQLEGLDSLPAARGAAFHWPLVANAALAKVMRGLYGGTTVEAAANERAIAELEAALEHNVGFVPPGIRYRSIKLGHQIGEAIFAYSTTDGGHEAYLDPHPASYVPPVGLGMWVPTPPHHAGALLPAWGDLRPFALSGGSDCDPGPPPPFSIEQTSDFYVDAREVYDVVRALTGEQRTMALFWADDGTGTMTPAGHQVMMATEVLIAQKASLELAAEVYARLGMALADAFVSSWWTKYEYVLIRPISYIQLYIDPAFDAAELPLVTPPFPEYTSGHSVQAGAAARVLTSMFGEMAFTDHAPMRFGMEPRSFGSFHDAAWENALSRMYGGVHYRFAIERGVAQGECVADRVDALVFRR